MSHSYLHPEWLQSDNMPLRPQAFWMLLPLVGAVRAAREVRLPVVLATAVDSQATNVVRMVDVSVDALMFPVKITWFLC